MSDKLSNITVGDIYGLLFSIGLLIGSFKLVVAPLVKKWLKIEDNSNKITQLPLIIAKQQTQIDKIDVRLEKGNIKFDDLEKFQEISLKKIEQIDENVNIIGRGVLALINNRLTGNSIAGLEQIKNDMEAKRGFVK